LKNFKIVKLLVLDPSFLWKLKFQNSAVSSSQINEKTASGKKRLRLGAFWLILAIKK